MGTRIEISSASGAPSVGYLAEAAPGSPGVVVIQEWWGLVPQIEATCDRYATAGFAALAPDLYGGVAVPLEEPDEAGRQMMQLEVARAAAVLSGAVDELVARTGRARVGVVGYCMGGGLSLKLGADRPDAVGAVADCYGLYAWEEGPPDYASLAGAVQIHCAALDEWVTPAAAEQLRATIATARPGADVELFVYEGVNHAFANEDRPDVYDEGASALLFDRTVQLFTSRLA